MECYVNSKLDGLMLEVGRMKDSRGDIQRQFELLYQRISMIKDQFELSSSYDSSCPTSDSECCSDENFSSQKLHEDTDESDRKIKQSEQTSVEFPQTAERGNENSVSENKEILDKDSDAQAIKNETGSQDSQEHPSSILITDTSFVEIEETGNHCDRRIRPNNYEENLQRILGKPDVENIHFKNEIVTIQNGVKMLNRDLEIQNAYTSKNSDTTGTGHEKGNSNTNIPGVKEGGVTASPTKLCLHTTRYFMLNIKPRRRLHDFVASNADNIDRNEYCNKLPNENPAKGECVDNGSVYETDIPLSAKSILELSEEKSELNETEESTESNAFSFICIEDGLISFHVKSNNTHPNSPNDSEDDSSTCSENSLEFLEFKDGFVSFKVESEEPYDLDESYRRSGSEKEDDIFPQDDTYGIEALFRNALTTGHSSKVNDEVLEGVAELFEEFDDTNVENQNENDKFHISYKLEPTGSDNTTNLIPQNKLGTERVSVLEEKQTTKESLHSKFESKRFEYSLTGVVLLKTLPDAFARSLFSNLFANPVCRVTFLNAFPPRSSCRLSSRDFAKMSFSSQELPLNKLTGLSFPENESHFETLSTSSKESSVESVCES